LDAAIKGFGAGKSIRALGLDIDLIKEYEFLTAKPILYIANTGEGEVCDDLLNPLKELAKKENSKVVVLCAKLEAEILELPPEERDVYYQSSGIVSTGLTALAKAGQELLKLVCFFTAGPTETRAWLIPQGTKAVKAAGKIHTDIERGFIRAEIYKFADLEREGSYQALREKNLISLEGKDYEIQDGDVVYFRFSV
jgi:hypothetical protein